MEQYICSLRWLGRCPFRFRTAAFRSKNGWYLNVHYQIARAKARHKCLWSKCVAVYEVRQSSKQRIVLRRLLQNRLWLLAMTSPSVTLLPSSVVPFLFFFYFRKLGQKFLKTVSLSQKTGTEGSPYFNSSFFGKLGQRYGENRDTNSQNVGRMFRENWDGIHFLLSIRYNFQFAFRGRYAAPPGYPCLEAYAFEKEGESPSFKDLLCIFFLEKVGVKRIQVVP